MGRWRVLSDESGQMAFTMLIAVFAVFVITALAFDAGLWYFDHRDAQSDSEAAALAAAGVLPATDTTAALAEANKYLVANGNPAATAGSCPTSGDGTHVQFGAPDPTTGKYSTVTVCIRRQAPGFFAALSGINFVHVSASSTALAGPVDGANVLPWAVVAPDPTCTEAAARNCLYDANGNGNYTDPGDCNAPFQVCPFGLTTDRLFNFKAGTGGNTGILAVCDKGASNYRDCLSGASVTGVYLAGTQVVVDVQSGTIAQATDAGLEQRSLASAWKLPGGNTCDVDSFPSPNLAPLSAQYPNSPGYDPVGAAAARAKYVNPSTNPQCAYRLVPVPIIDFLPPNGSATVNVLGVATFGVAKWNSTGPQDTYFGSSTTACHDTGSKQQPKGTYPCGVVWGYLMSGARPPQTLLEKIGGNNPLAPILIALTN